MQIFTVPIVVAAQFSCSDTNSISDLLFLDMVYLDEAKATCRVLDEHPDTKQRKLSFLVRASTTSVHQLLAQVSTQYAYDKFDLIFETKNVSATAA